MEKIRVIKLLLALVDVQQEKDVNFAIRVIRKETLITVFEQVLHQDYTKVLVEDTYEVWENKDGKFIMMFRAMHQVLHLIEKAIVVDLTNLDRDYAQKVIPLSYVSDTDGMTREEAQSYLRKGGVLRHRLFLPDEFLRYEKGQLRDENDYCLGWQDFWDIRTADVWATGWIPLNIEP